MSTYDDNNKDNLSQPNGASEEPSHTQESGSQQHDGQQAPSLETTVSQPANDLSAQAQQPNDQQAGTQQPVTQQPSMQQQGYVQSPNATTNGQQTQYQQAGGQPYYSQQPPYQQGNAAYTQQNGSQSSNFQAPPPYPPYNQSPKTNGKSIVSLVLGICSLFVPYVGFLIGIVGIIFAALSFKELKSSGEQGRGFTIGGLVCSILGTLFWGIIGIIVIVVFIFAFSEGSSYNNNFYY